MQLAMAHFEALDPNLSQHLIWDTLETIAPPGEDDPQQQQSRDIGVAVMLESFRPATPFEAMLATHVVALHHGAMGCYRWAMYIDRSSAGAARLRRDGMAMTRTMVSAEAAIRTGQARRTPNDAAGERGAPAASATPHWAGPGAADRPPSVPLEITRRPRGDADLGESAPAVRGLAGRSSESLSDHELDVLGRATATPDAPYDPSWQEAQQPPPSPYWESLTSGQRLSRFGWQSEEQLAVDQAAPQKDGEAPPDDAG